MLRLWRLWRVGGRDLRLLWFALGHPARPAWLWPMVVLAALYALDPFNFAIPPLGVVDDLVILPVLLHMLLKLLPPGIRADFDGRSRIS